MIIIFIIGCLIWYGGELGTNREVPKKAKFVSNFYQGMRDMDKEQVYINLETKYSVNLNTHVYVKDIGEVYCSNDTVKKNVENIRI